MLGHDEQHQESVLSLIGLNELLDDMTDLTAH